MGFRSFVRRMVLGHACRELAGALLVTGCCTAVQGQPGEAQCLPVAGNSMWTADEIESNRTRIAHYERVVGQPFPAPAYGEYRRKYDHCVNWMRDSESKVMYDLLSQYEVMQGLRSLVVEPLDVALNLAFDGFGPYGAPIKKRLLEGTQGALFSPKSDAEMEDIVASRIVDLQRAHPDDDLAQLMTRLKAGLARTGQDLGELDESTTTWLDGIAHKVMLKRQMSEERPYAGTSQQAQQQLGAKVQQFDRGAKQQRSAVTQLKGQVGEAAAHLQRGAPTPAAGGTSVDWDRLRKAKETLDAKAGSASAANGMLKAALGNDVLRQELGLSPEDLKVLTDDLASRESLRKAQLAAKDAAEKSNALAKAFDNLGWDEGARAFAALAQASDGLSNAANALLSTVAGPPGPWQMIGAFNSMFSVANALSGAFGGGKRRDDGLAKALQQIFAGLRTLSDQIAQLRKEQRENFRYAERSLDVLVELASNGALAGAKACQAMGEMRADWDRRTGGDDLRDALDSPQADALLVVRAGECYRWLMAAETIPIGDSGVNVLFTQRLTLTTDTAARYALELAAFKNLGFQRAERDWPALRGLVDDATVTATMTDRVSWSEPLVIADDLGLRMRKAGLSRGESWTLSSLLDAQRMVSTATVATAAHGALVVQPAVTRLVEARTVSAADQAHGAFASVLRDLYALTIVNVAQERLIAGGPIAEHIDQLLDESDRRSDLRRLDECLAQGRLRAECAAATGVSTTLEVEACTPIPNDKAMSFCGRWGQGRFDAKVANAVTSIKAFPILRQNVLGARLWRLGRAHAHGVNGAPLYETALASRVKTLDGSADPGAIELSRLFGGLRIAPLGDDEALDRPLDPHLKNGTYFVRLAGACSGLRQRALLMVSSCDGMGCSFEIGKNTEGKAHLVHRGQPGKLRGGEEEDADACVMAAMPSADEFAHGRILATASLERIHALAERLAMSIVFDNAYRAAGPDERALIALRLRPPGAVHEAADLSQISDQKEKR
jgi:hypothetical protein